MEKSTLISFIEKYSLAGSVESVKLVSDGSVLKTAFVSEDRNLAGSVVAKTIKLDAAELSIFDTSRFKSFLKILDSDINIAYTYEDVEGEDGNSSKTLTGLALSDPSTEVNFVLSDPSVIPTAPKVKEIKQFEVEIPITEDFVNRFVKAKSVLPEVEAFTLLMNKKGDKLELVIGHSSTNTNRVKVDVKPTQGKDKLTEAISFNANYFRDILLANKDASGAVLKVCAAGIAQITFSTDTFEANYYLIKKNIES